MACNSQSIDRPTHDMHTHIHTPTSKTQIKDFDAKPYFNDKKASVRNDRVTLLGVAASKIALEDAKMDLGAIDGGGFGRGGVGGLVADTCMYCKLY